jgi:hypothetical protein
VAERLAGDTHGFAVPGDGHVPPLSARASATRSGDAAAAAPAAMTVFSVAEPLDVSIAYYDRGAKPADAYHVAPASPSPDIPRGRLHLRLEAERRYFGDSPVFFRALQLHQRARVEAGLPRIVRVTPPEAYAQLAAVGAIPPRIGRACSATAVVDEIAGRRGDEVIRIAVINIFHQAFGDALASLVGLRELRRVLARRFGRVEIDLFQHRCNHEGEALYLRSGVVGAIHPLPAPLDRLAAYDAYVDTTGERVAPDAHWLDLCIAACGVDPVTVPAGRKRMRVPIAPAAAREVADDVTRARRRGRPVLLFHPSASSPIRACPPEVAEAFVREVLRRTPWTVAAVVPLGIEDPRVVDWSGVSRTFDHFACLAAHADLVVSADTVVYHLADAFDVPAVALFTSIPPACRTAYSPCVEGISLAPDPNPIVGRGSSSDPEAVAHAQAMWRTLDVGRVIAALRDVVRRRRAASPTDDGGLEPQPRYPDVLRRRAARARRHAPALPA